MPIDRILMATDLATKSDAALRHAAYLAEQLNAALVVTHVVPSRDLHLAEGAHRPGRLGDAAVDEAAREVAAQLARTGIPEGKAMVDVRFGDPGLDVIAAAKEYDCSLIVIAVESRSKLGKLLLGSHAQQIMLDSSIPVVGVKPDWTPPG